MDYCEEKKRRLQRQLVTGTQGLLLTLGAIGGTRTSCAAGVALAAAVGQIVKRLDPGEEEPEAVRSIEPKLIVGQECKAHGPIRVTQSQKMDFAELEIAFRKRELQWQEGAG
jgi:hypothetical protein